MVEHPLADPEHELVAAARLEGGQLGRPHESGLEKREVGGFLLVLSHWHEPEDDSLQLRNERDQDERHEDVESGMERGDPGSGHQFARQGVARDHGADDGENRTHERKDHRHAQHVE